MRKLLVVCLVLLLSFGTMSLSFGEETSVEIENIRVRMIIGSSTTLLENAVVGDGMGEYDQESIDTYQTIVDNYLSALTENVSEDELLALEEELTEAYRIFTGSRNAVQSEIDSYNKYLDDATNLFNNVAVGNAVGDVSPANHEAMMAYLGEQEKYDEGQIIQLGIVRAKDEEISEMITTYLVYNEEAIIVEEPVIEEPVVEEPVLPEPIVEEPVVEETIPETIVDLVETKEEAITAEALEELNKEIIALIQDAERLTNLNGDTEESKALFEEIIVPIGDHYNDLDRVEQTSKEIMNESIGLANITIALSGDVELDGESLIIEEDEVLVEPTITNLITAVNRTETVEKEVEALMSEHLDDGLEDAVVSAVNIAVPETLKSLPTTKISLTNETVKLLNESTVERVNLDMGTINFGINDKFLEVNDDKSLQFFVERQESLDEDEVEAIDPEAEQLDLPIYDLGANQDEIRGDAFKHPVALSFDMSEVSGELADNEIFVVYRLNEETGEWETVSGFYNPITDEITVSRLHLSKYTVLKSEKNFANIEDSWAKNEIAALKSNGVIKETELFNPNDAISREEFASWIVTAYGLDSETLETDFIDIDKESQYYEAVAVAYEHGIVKGDSDGTFKPTNDISKAELAFMIASAMDQYEYSVDTDTFDLAQYEEDLPTWAMDSVETVVENGLVEEQYFGTADVVTKEEAASILFNVYR